MRRLLKALLVLAWLGARWFDQEPGPAAKHESRMRRLERLERPKRPEPSETLSDASSGKFKQWLWHAAILLVLLAVGGLAVAASGVIPIKASSGHWPMTRWFLSFSMSRSVSTHSLGVKVPPLDDFGLVLKGAGHYETGCRGCHGSPSLPHPRVAQGMTPKPPYLPETISQWEPEELFYIVKHGVKFAGMPAWPSQQRDDEVWAMVAFLQKFPELDAEQYQQWVHGATDEAREVPPLESLLGPDSGALNGTRRGEIPQAVSDSCARCHGWDGRGRGEGAFPRLAGQRVAYLRASLEAFAHGARHSGIMEPVSAGLSPEEIDELARYYADLAIGEPETSPEPKPSNSPPDGEAADATEGAETDSAADSIARGEMIARRGVPEHKVPACSACHGPAVHPRNPIYPILAGQSASYLALQLELFKKQHRGGSPYAHIMEKVAAQLSESEIRDVTLYYQSLDSSLTPRRSE